MMKPRHYILFACFCLGVFSSCSVFQKSSANLPEINTRFTWHGDVAVTINASCDRTGRTERELLLIFFALPNTNTTAWTFGKLKTPSDNWRFDIQHIGAQTRFLRAMMPERDIVTAYLENAGRSWPQWREKNPDNPVLIRALIDTVASLYGNRRVSIMLSGHSGGGSLLFGFLNGVDSIPAGINRITFLDSDYAYDDSLHHGDKLSEWLRRGPGNALTVLAYNDSIALLNGKPIVSATGGTWYRTKKMLRRLEQDFPFTVDSLGGLERYRALDGRITIWLKENPERAIYHTVQVERNGFIESVCAGTVYEGRGYTYYGARAYTHLIDSDSLAIQ